MVEQHPQSGGAAGGAVRVVAPARLHLGFLDLHGGLGRKFGSLGVTLEEPRTALTVAFTGHPRWTTDDG